MLKFTYLCLLDHDGLRTLYGLLTVHKVDFRKQSEKPQNKKMHTYLY